MLRLMTLIGLVLLAVVTAGLYGIAQRVQHLEREAARLERAIAREQNAIRVLRAEWAYLTEPARLQELSARFLDLAPVPARQMASLSELPGPMLGFAAFDPYASSYASPDGGLVPRPAVLDGRANQPGERP